MVDMNRRGRRFETFVEDALAVPKRRACNPHAYTAAARPCHLSKACRAKGGLVINRREFLETIAIAVPAFGWQGTPANEWGSPVFDLHFHLRPQPAANLAHLDGTG